MPLFSSRPPASSEPTIEVHDTIVDPIDPVDTADGAEVPPHFRETELEPAPTIEVREVEMGDDELELPPTRSVGTWEPLGAAATTMSLDEAELPDPVVLPSTRRGVARFALSAVAAVGRRPRRNDRGGRRLGGRAGARGRRRAGALASSSIDRGIVATDPLLEPRISWISGAPSGRPSRHP